MSFKAISLCFYRILMNRARIYGRLKQPYKAIDDFISSIITSDPERMMVESLPLKISFTTKNYL